MEETGKHLTTNKLKLMDIIFFHLKPRICSLQTAVVRVRVGSLKLLNAPRLHSLCFEFFPVFSSVGIEIFIVLHVWSIKVTAPFFNSFGSGSNFLINFHRPLFVMSLYEEF